MSISEIDVEELERARASGTTVLDVREPDEYSEAHVPGALLIPLGELPDRLGEIPDGPIAVICRSGGRSAKATEMLVARGVDAVSVAGGTLAWLEAGKTAAVGPEPG